MEEKYLIGNKIRELRKRTGLTLKELSERDEHLSDVSQRS